MGVGCFNVTGIYIGGLVCIIAFCVIDTVAMSTL